MIMDVGVSLSLVRFVHPRWAKAEISEAGTVQGPFRSLSRSRGTGCSKPRLAESNSVMRKPGGIAAPSSR